MSVYQHENSFRFCLMHPPPAGPPCAEQRAARHSELQWRPAATVLRRGGRPGKCTHTETQTVGAGGRAAGGGVGRCCRRRLDSRFV